MGERNFGARWWRESLGIGRWATRPVASTFGLLGALSLSGCATVGEAEAIDETQLADARDDVDVSVDALALQREQGWDVGQLGAALAFPDSSTQDAAGGESWRAAMNDLAGTLAPSSPALQPYYVPTLYQSLVGPDGQRLRAVMRPIHSAEMDADFARGLALRQQFGTVGWPKDTALVVDAPGPRAVAVAAALSDRFTPVFTFANWPHPLGVVPAHQTLAASLFYLPIFRASESARPLDAPPLFVLDANRLAPYRDADKQFDNRYFVHLPSAADLLALGIKHVLYVSADDARELDDLNAALVDLCGKGVDVKMVALGDFVRADGEDAVAAAEESEPVEVDEPAYASVFVGMSAAWWGAPFWYRRCWWDAGLFWHDYGASWIPPGGFRGGYYGPARGPVRIGPPSVHRVPLSARAVAWVAAPRPTVFAGRAVVAPNAIGTVGVRPPNFGQVAVRASRADGRLTGVRAGLTGSFGGNAARGASFGSGGGFQGGNAVFHSSGGGFHGGNAVFHSSGGGFGRSGSIGRTSGGGFGGG
jgi:hypothetical protein